MNKFEQVSSDHHQMSLLGDKSPGVNGGVPLPCDLSHDAFDVTYPYEQTDACENITFSQLYLGAVNMENLYANAVLIFER